MELIKRNLSRLAPVPLNNPIVTHFDKVTHYHYYFFSILFMIKLPIFWHILSLIFLSPPMTYTCKSGGSLERRPLSSGGECPCDSPEWDRSVFTQTMQTKYGILCDKKWLVSFSQSVVYIGALIGALSFGFLSDKFGRLFMLSMSCMVLATSGCLVAFMPTIWTFIFMRCIEGIGFGGAIVGNADILNNKYPTDKMKADMETYFSKTESSTVTKVSFWQIFRYRSITINLICMSVIFFVCGMGYYGVSQYIGKMSGNIHMNVAISGAVLIPGSVVAAYCLKTFGRRSFLMTTNFLSGIFMITVIAIPATAVLARVVIACICNCFFFMSFIIVFLYGVELFPTSIRSSVLGFLSLLSRVGQINAPFVNSLPESVSGAIFGSMAILGGCLCYPLPETKNIDLPTTLEEASNLPRGSSKPSS